MKSFLDWLTTKRIIWMIIVVGFVVYLNTFLNNFVMDDNAFIISNPEVHSINIPFLFGKNLFNDGVYYRPFQAVYAAILYSMFSTNVLPYHLMQLFIHLAATVCLFIVFKNFFDKTFAFIFSLVFLVHPIQVESASYIAQTASPLFFLFGIMALIVTIKDRIKTQFPLIGIFLLLSLFTKETGSLFVILVILYSFLYKTNQRLRVLRESIVTIFIYLAFRIGIAHTLFEKSLLYASIARAPLFERLITIPAVALYYLKTFIFPASLSISQHWVITTPTLIAFYLPLLIDVFILGAIILGGIFFLNVSKKTFYSYLFFSAWFLVGFFFHLQLVPLDMTVADRWFYFPLAGLLGMIGVSLSYINFGVNTRKAVLAILLISIVTLSIRTIIRNKDWIDAITLDKHDMKISNNFELENNLGWELIQTKDYPDAIVHLNKSIEMWSGWDRSWYNLGVAYHLSGNVVEAKKSYERALTINSKYVQVIENLSALMVFNGDPVGAKELATSTLFKFPERFKLWYYLSLADYKLGNKDEALQDITKAYQLNPNDGDINNVFYLLKNNDQIIFN